MQAKNSTKVKNILNILAEHINVKGIKGLARYLGEPSTKLYGWVRNGKIYDTNLILTKLPYINEEWLMTGEGPFAIVDETNKHLIPPSKYAPDTTGLIKPEAPHPTKPKPKEIKEAPFSIAEMLSMTARVLESDTVYRSALASNVRAFHQAVENEVEMKSVKEKLDAVTDRLERMEKMLESLGAQAPEKRDEQAKG